MIFEFLYDLILVPEGGGSWGWSVAQGNLRITVSDLQAEEPHHQRWKRANWTTRYRTWGLRKVERLKSKVFWDGNNNLRGCHFTLVWNDLVSQGKEKCFFGTLSHLKHDPNKVVNDFVFEQYFRPRKRMKVPGNCQSAKTTANCPKEASKSIDQKLIWYDSLHKKSITSFPGT